MRARATLGAVQTITIGVVSAAAVFVLHRAFFSDALPPPVSRGSALSSGASTSVEAPAGPAAEVVQESLARAERADRGEEAVAAAARRALPSPGRDVPNPHLEALRSPSPIYRNVSLLTVIRAAGYVCTDILSSAAGDDALATWRVSCENAQAYLIAEDGVGGLRVEPIAYFEMPVRPRMEQVPAPLNSPPQVLPAPR